MVAPTQTPVYPSYPPGHTPPQPPRRRLWPAFVGVGVGSAAIAALVTALIASGSNSAEPITSRAATATTTVTVAPSSPAPQAALPTAQADRQTCQAWATTGGLVKAASAAQSVIPEGLTVLSPEIKTHPEWQAAVNRAADLYGQGGDLLAGRIAPGTTPVLAETSHAAAAALRGLSIAFKTSDPANGNSYSLAKESGDAMDAYCTRLAP